MQISSQCVPFAVRGRVLGTLTLSYTIGDVISRAVLGAILATTTQWRQLLYWASGLTLTATIPFLVFIHFKAKVYMDAASIAAGEAPPVDPRSATDDSDVYSRVEGDDVRLIPRAVDDDDEATDV